MTTITYLGHGSLIIETKGFSLVVDPFISANDKAEVDISTIKADYVLLTHGHQDHILDAEDIAKNNDATIISNYEIATYYGNKGLKSHPMNHGGKYEFPFGTLKYVPAIHSSSFPDGTYAGNPGGFVLWNEHSSIYLSGDTSLTMDMKLIPMFCPKLDVAVLPIGDNFTMGYEEACMASDFVQCDRIIGCHYDTFEIIQIDTDEAKQYFIKANKKLLLPAIGESIEL